MRKIRKLRRILQAFLFVNFMAGMHNGMRAWNLAAVLINGVIVLAMIRAERKDQDDKKV